jgi:hypothetical protein
MARYSVSSSLVYTWRKQARLGLFGPMKRGDGKQGAFALVAIVEAAVSLPSDSPICFATSGEIAPEPLSHNQIEHDGADHASQSDGTAMVVALPDGVRILVNNGVDEGALGKVLRALGR